MIGVAPSTTAPIASSGCESTPILRTKSGQGHILDMVSIRERPAEIEDRAVPGHWEGDLLTGANDTHVATLVERNTRFTMLVKISRKYTTTIVSALAKHISKLPEELRCSLTWDQGKEMHAHKRFTVATNIQVYFCDPRSPWHAAQTRTPTACCVSTSREEPTSRASLRVI
jgi:IS30 family transposase